MIKSSLKHFSLRVLVGVMKLMTRYVNGIARPIVKWVADHEVIACGLRGKDGRVYVIYTPSNGRGEHSVYRRRHGGWEKVLGQEVAPFSDTVVRQLLVPDARVGEVLQIRAMLGKKVIRSPKITVKESSPDISDMLARRNMIFSWPAAESLDPMIYFLVVEQDDQTQTAIYTRETRWVYPKVKQASLSVGRHALQRLDEQKSHRAKLLAVDYDGWVGGQGEIIW